MKIKKLLMILLLGIILIPTTSHAKEDERIYYTNLNGVSITEEQYNNLSKVFDENTIATMERRQIDYYKNNKNLTKTESVKYVRIDEYFDHENNLTNRIETEVTEKEAMNYVNSIEKKSSAKSPSHQTTMKKITISLVMGYSVKTITINNTWLSIPSTKSYDVIAFRNGTGTSVSINSVSGYQHYDNSTISYNTSSNNYKSTAGGCGISMNIVDSVSSSLSNSMSVTIINNSTTYTAYGTYQHATSDVTLSQSKNYSISSSGLGGVLAFANSVIGYYDGMQGVDITGSL